MLRLMAPPPPPDPVMVMTFSSRPIPVPPQAPLLPHFSPVAPHLAAPSIPTPLVETPTLKNSITVPPAPPPVSPAQPGPPTPPSPHAPPTPDYLARLMAHLEAHKDYPRPAQEAHIQGVVQVRFTMDRQGHVLSFAMVKSSGVPLLDRGAQNTVMNAQPMPPMPPDYPGETLTLTLPINFHIGR